MAIMIATMNSNNCSLSAESGGRPCASGTGASLGRAPHPKRARAPPRGWPSARARGVEVGPSGQGQVTMRAGVPGSQLRYAGTSETPSASMGAA